MYAECRASIWGNCKYIDIYAKKCIKIGEEIVLDYGKEFIDYFNEFLGGCKCQTCLNKESIKRLE